MTDPRESPSQTAGPYLHIGCMPNAAGIAGVVPADMGVQVFDASVNGAPITLSGRILDGEGTAVTDALVEIRQVGPDGLLPKGANGWGRQTTDPETGLFRFQTLRPGPAPHAPHVSLWIVARGINLGLHTRVYLPDAVENATDPLLAQLGTLAQTLIATGAAPDFHHDIHLQGPHETVFLDV